MDSNPSDIPVESISFKHALPVFAKAVRAGRLKIVAIGSSTTYGEGNIVPYPTRLFGMLQQDFTGATIAMVNSGVSGEEAPKEFRRFDTDVISHKPDLVIWQVGTNAVWQSADQNPPSFQETMRALHDGLAELQSRTEADIVLMDL